MSYSDDDGPIVDLERRWYLLISNPSKTTHLGTLLRCAAAFRAHKVLLVGYDKFNCQGSFGSHLFLDILVFPSWDGVVEYLRNGGGDDDDDDDDGAHRGIDDDHDDDGARGNDDTNQRGGQGEKCEMSRPRRRNDPIDIVGILGAYGGDGDGALYSPNGMAVYEGQDSFVSPISPEGAGKEDDTSDVKTTRMLPHRSYPIHTRPFSSDVCFLLSRDIRGMPIPQARLCAGFVHVPHLSYDDDDAALSIDRPPSPRDSASRKLQTNNDASIATTTRITQSNLLDTATTLSIVLHHYTAWAGYAERTFNENSKFVKDAKPNARRRLCRVIGGYDKGRDRDGDDGEDAMDSMTLWNETCGESQGGDY